jgi:hypothetical protein
MKRLHTFEGFINEGLKTGDQVTHKLFPEIKGKIVEGPTTYGDLEKKVKGIDMPEDDDVYVKPYINKPVWIAILLDDGQTQFGANLMEFK